MNNHTNSTIEEFITSIQIKDRISKLAKCIELDHQSQKLIALIVLKGSICFAADLLREIDLDVQIEFIHLSSYKGGVSTDIEMKSISSKNFSGERIIIIEDIIDTGKTVNYISEYLVIRTRFEFDITVVFGTLCKHSPDPDTMVGLVPCIIGDPIENCS